MTGESFLTVAEAMAPTTVSVNVDDSVGAAAGILRRESLAGLPVVAKDRVVGLVTPLQILQKPPYRPVGAFMTRGITPATPELSLPQAYALMAKQGVEVLPVVDAGAIVGQISKVAVLRSQGQQTDPLTGLPWGTALRAWASAALANGREVAILFVDLDNFGEINKVLGHVAGDDILRSITHLLASLTDPSTDLLCRYGGDEFVIATTRPEDDMRTLVARIESQVVVPVDLEGDLRRLTASVGVAGGRRDEGRTPVHVPATVEDLLALASRESTAVKTGKSAIAAAAAGASPLIEASAAHDEQSGDDQAQAGPSEGTAPARPAPVRWHRVALGAAAAAVLFALGVAESDAVLHGLSALAPRRAQAVPTVTPPPRRAQAAPTTAPAPPPPAPAPPPPAPRIAAPRIRVPGYAVSVGTFPTRPEATRVMHLARSKGYVVFVVPREAKFEVVTSPLRRLIAGGVADALQFVGFQARAVRLRTAGQGQ